MGYWQQEFENWIKVSGVLGRLEIKGKVCGGGSGRISLLTPLPLPAHTPFYTAAKILKGALSVVGGRPHCASSGISGRLAHVGPGEPTHCPPSLSAGTGRRVPPPEAPGLGGFSLIPAHLCSICWSEVLMCFIIIISF